MYGLPMYPGIPSYIQTYTHVLCIIHQRYTLAHKIEIPIHRLSLQFNKRFEFLRAQMHALGAHFSIILLVKVSESNLPIDTVALRVDGHSLVQTSASFDVISPRENIPTTKIITCVLRYCAGVQSAFYRCACGVC